MTDKNSSEVFEARVIVRRGDSLVPLTEWMAPEKFTTMADAFNALVPTMPRSVHMTVETRKPFDTQQEEQE